MRLSSLALLIGLLGLCGGPVGAQDPREVYLPVDHWSRAALLRLAGLDAIPPVQGARAWPLRRDEVRDLLSQAATSDDPAAAGIAGRQLRAFDTEFAQRDGSLLTFNFGGGWSAAGGQLLGGTSMRGPNGAWDYPGPTALSPSNGAASRVVAELAVARFTLAIAAVPADAWRSNEAWLNVGLGPVDVWAGRRGLGFGDNGGAFVLSGDVAFDGGGIRTARTWTPPWVFAHLGAVDASFTLARFGRSGVVERPWFAASRIVLSPARRVVIGLNRAALFGGGGNVQPTSFRNLLFVVGGLTSQLGKDSGYENQVASMDVRVSTRAAGLPLVLHGELAIDDVGFNLFRTAAFTAGVDIPALPGAGGLGVGLEHTRIPGSCCTQPPWYRHGDLGDGWTMGGQLLGHPLGGHGSEWRLRLSQSSRVVQLGAEILARTRGQENLLAPDHGGPSAGGSLVGVATLARDVVLSGGASAERGADGWWVWKARLGLRFRLHVAGGRSGGATRETGPRKRIPRVEDER